MDSGDGHGHIRHEGWVTEEANRRRVVYQEDPAQPDPEKRLSAIDGLKQGDQPHRCRTMATRIADPDAFATAFTRGVEHPRVRAALEMAFGPNGKPDEVAVPIADLLGPEGHRHCTGWQLEPVDGSLKTTRTNRAAWIEATAAGRKPEVPEPQAAPVATFKGGAIVFAFTRTKTINGTRSSRSSPGLPSRNRQMTTPEPAKEQRDGIVLLGASS
jgi:hypothetical protein